MKDSPLPTYSETDSVERISVRDAGRVYFLSLDEIDWVEADRNYVEIHVGSKVLTHRETMAGFFKRLPQAKFAKVHRSVIVNLDKIKELRTIERGEYEIILEGGQALETNLGLRDLKDLIEAS